ncbi:MAG: two-component regulator propeller domain-containing protein [Flavobacteriales bacterium]
MKVLSCLFSFAIAFIFCSAVFSQAPVFRSFNLGEGKKTLKVQSIEQNSENHVFYGTNNGLIKFNGVEYITIDFPDSLGKVSVTALYFEAPLLWIGTSKGEVWTLTADRLQLFSTDSFSTQAKISNISSGAEHVSIATYGDGIYFVNKSNQTVQHFTSLNGLADDYTYDVLWFADKIWIGTDAGITELDQKDFTANQHSMKHGLPDNIVRSLCAWDDKTIAIGMHDYGLALLNTGDYSIKMMQNQSAMWSRGPVEDICKDKSGRLWVATKNDGLLCYEQEGASGVVCKSLTEINGLGSNRVLSLKEDAEHNVWIGTQEGVSLYSGSTFEYLTKSEGLVGNSIFDVMLDKSGRIWMACEKGVMQYSFSESGEGLVKLYLENNGTSGPQIVSLLEDSKGNIWMGSYGDGLFKLNPDDGKITKYSSADGLTNTNVLDLVQDAKGRLWLATLGSGIVKVDFDGTRPIFTSVEDPQMLLSQYIYTLHVDKDQQLWIGTDGGGLSMYDCQGDYFKPGVVEELKSASIFAISKYQDDTWIATSESGLYRYSRGSLTQFLEPSGLRSTSITSLASLPNGDLVTIHSLGIDVLTHGAETFIPFYLDKSTFQFEPYLNATYVDGDAVWIGSETGVVKFNPNDRKAAAAVPKVTLTGLRVLYEEMPFSQMQYDYEQNHFVFDYLAVWMKDPEAIIYQYILEGFDKQWSFETQSRLATYSSLPPGKYTFRVRASSGDGNWSDPQESSFSFVILKPFWMQWWFYTILVIVISAGVGAFIRYRTQKLLADKKRLEHEVDKRTTEIRHQKEIIEVKNEEILSSITYAQRIQSAILPPDRLIKERFPESFVLYKPKDIVAGDFYWMEHVNPIVQMKNDLKDMETPDLDLLSDNGKTMIAAADCTGHGVPGAMVSVVCNNALNRSVREYGLIQPSSILDKTRELVIEQFMLSEEEVKDGMDIAICSLSKSTREGEDGQMILEYAGAQNPLWIVTKRRLVKLEGGDILAPDMSEGEYHLMEVKPDKQPIGKYAEQRPFVNHTIRLVKGDMFFIFTDGYADQFGGDRGKKLKYKPMKRLILSLSGKFTDQIHKALDEHIESWRGELEQVDDICVIGVRV